MPIVDSTSEHGMILHKNLLYLTMVHEVKYTDDLGRFLTFPEVEDLKNYDKISYKDGQTKIIESFTNYRESAITYSYFMSSVEDKQTVLDGNTDPTINKSCILYFDKQVSMEYVLWEWEEFGLDKLLKFRGKVVFDNHHRTILSCSNNLQTNVLEDASKFYYINEFKDELSDRLLEFTYKENGEIDLIFDSNENYGYVDGISLSEFLNDRAFSVTAFPWDEHSYYHSFYPLLPISKP